MTSRGLPFNQLPRDCGGCCAESLRGVPVARSCVERQRFDHLLGGIGGPVHAQLLAVLGFLFADCECSECHQHLGELITKIAEMIDVHVQDRADQELMHNSKLNMLGPSANTAQA